jgi:hypothetical protein
VGNAPVDTWKMGSAGLDEFPAQLELLLRDWFRTCVFSDQIGVLGFTKIKKWSVSDVQSLRMLLSDGECRNSDGIGH